MAPTSLRLLPASCGGLCSQVTQGLGLHLRQPRECPGRGQGQRMDFSCPLVLGGQQVVKSGSDMSHYFCLMTFLQGRLCSWLGVRYQGSRKMVRK